MANKESLFASLHILMRAIPDGPADAGRRLHRYWYRESRCQVRTGWQKLCAFVYSWLYLLILAYLSSRSVKIRVNPWLINHLPAFGISTLVVSALQIHLFMQNEPKFRKSQMNVTKVLTREYDLMDTWSIGKNEPKTNPKRTQNEPKRTQTNPNKAKFEKAKMNVTKVLTKDYEKKLNWAICENEPKTNPKQTQSNTIQTQCLSAISVAGQRQKYAAVLNN